MAERIISNRKNGSITIHSTVNCSMTIVGNSSVSNLATGDEVVSGANIKRIYWGGDALITIKRGSNVVLQLTQSGYLGFADHGDSINLDPAATFVATLPTNGYIVVELSKAFSVRGSSEY